MIRKELSKMHDDHFDELEHSAEGARWFSPEDLTYTESGEVSYGPLPGEDTVGHPETEAADWQYQGDSDGLCGPASIAMVLNEMGRHDDGHPFTAADVAGWAVTHGEMTPDGQAASATNFGYVMTAGQISAVLAHYGVDNEAVSGGSLASLEGYLATGHQVILGVDAYRIWHNIPASEDPGHANHAVVLTGIDERTGWAYINDPGSPDGRMEAVPLSELTSAWETGDNTAIVTDASADHESHHSHVILPAVLRHEAIRLLDELVD